MQYQKLENRYICVYNIQQVMKLLFKQKIILNIIIIWT